MKKVNTNVKNNKNRRRKGGKARDDLDFKCEEAWGEGCTRERQGPGGGQGEVVRVGDHLRTASFPLARKVLGKVETTQKVLMIQEFFSQGSGNP